MVSAEIKVIDQHFAFEPWQFVELSEMGKSVLAIAKLFLGLFVAFLCPRHKIGKVIETFFGHHTASVGLMSYTSMCTSSSFHPSNSVIGVPSSYCATSSGSSSNCVVSVYRHLTLLILLNHFLPLFSCALRLRSVWGMGCCSFRAFCLAKSTAR